MSRFSFTVGNKYTRREIKERVGLDPNARGGAWDTGYVQHAGADFVFCHVGHAGRTGHDYRNYFDGDDLVWRGKTGSHKHQPTIRRMTASGAEVHIFWRANDRDPFTYAGLGIASNAGSDDVPVEVRWRFRNFSSIYPDEVERDPKRTFVEGSVRSVQVNAYERNPEARRVCIEYHGTACKVCAFDFAVQYGDLGRGFIHVHHKVPLAEIRTTYELDPIRDLAPVCPNCHAMLHRSNPPMTIEELKSLIRK